MRQHIEGHHNVDEDGNPAGGHTVGKGIDIYWQNGPLGRPINAETQTKIDSCSQPFFHETHRYCPSCPWTEDLGRKEPNGAFVEGVIAAAVDRLEFYQSGKFECEENAKAIALLEEALATLDSRTASRESRGVEGTHEL